MNRVWDERRWRGHGGGLSWGRWGCIGTTTTDWESEARLSLGSRSAMGVGRGWGPYMPPPTVRTQTLQRARARESVCCSTEHLPPTKAHLSCIWFRAPSCFLHLFGSVLLSPGVEGTKMSETQPLSKSPKYKLILSAYRVPSTVLSVLQGLIH